MTEVKIFKIEQKFKGVNDLYRYLLKNADLISELTGIQMQKPLKERPFCLTGKEKITERDILLFASSCGFPENLGELNVLAGAFDAGIIVFFLQKTSKTSIDALNWLQKICNADTQFIVGEVQF